jgi:hypothetical protein
LVAVQQDLAHFLIQVGAAAGHAPAVSVHSGDHREQQWVGGQVIQRRLADDAVEEVAGR